MNEVAVCAGCLFAFWFGSIAVSSGVEWRVVLAWGGIPAVVQLAMLPLAPESPRWLALHGRGRQLQVVAAKLGIHPEELRELEKEAIARGQHQATWGHAMQAQREAWQKHGKAFWIALGFSACSSGSSIYAMQAYAVDIFAEGGVGDPYAVLPYLGVCKLLGAVLAMSVSDMMVVGRRRLSMAGATACAISNLLLAVAIPNGAGGLTVFACLSFIFCWNLGVGGLQLVVIAELVPSSVRSAWAGQILALSTLVEATVYQTFESSLVADPRATMLFYAAINGAAALFACFILPETAGRTLEEMHQDPAVPSGRDVVEFQEIPVGIASRSRLPFQGRYGRLVEYTTFDTIEAEAAPTVLGKQHSHQL